MRAYSRKERQVRQFQERTESLAKTGDKIASIQNAFGPFCPLLYRGFYRPAFGLWGSLS